MHLRSRQILLLAFRSIPFLVDCFVIGSSPHAQHNETIPSKPLHRFVSLADH